MNYQHFSKQELIKVLKQKDETIKTLNKEINKLKYYASIDGMTKTFNRRAGMEILEEKMRMTKIYKQPLSICFIDIDQFKKINDTFGHAFGDKLLIDISRILKYNIRKVDIVFRIGGDEFIIIFPNTTRKQAVKVWNRICEKISEINKYGLYQYDISLSCGFSEYDSNSEISVEDLVKNADREMYKKKRTHMENA
ncbi:GGDEF domain-containing protein [Clostridiaceae bacterium 35-E11]